MIFLTTQILTQQGQARGACINNTKSFKNFWVEIKYKKIISLEDKNNITNDLTKLVCNIHARSNKTVNISTLIFLYKKTSIFILCILSDNNLSRRQNSLFTMIELDESYYLIDISSCTLQEILNKLKHLYENKYKILSIPI